MKDRPALSVVRPFHINQNITAPLLTKVAGALTWIVDYEPIAIDDGLTDKTGAAMLRVHPEDHRRKLAQHPASTPLPSGNDSEFAAPRLPRPT